MGPVRVARAAATLAFLVAAAAITAEARQDRIPRQAPQYGVVIGTVVDATTGIGVARAAVTIRGERTALAIETDPLGRYYFVALPEGEYDITVTHRSYATGSYGQLRAGGEPQRLYLRPGEWRIDADVRLWRHAVISGIVVDEAGEPVIGARVNAMRREHTSTGARIADIASDLTDDRGRFRIGRLAPGEYLVMTPSVQVSVPTDSLTEVANTGSAGSGLMAALLFGAGLESGEAPTMGAALERLRPFDDDVITVGGLMPPGMNAERRYAYPTQYFPAVDIPSLALPVPIAAGEEFMGVSFMLRPVPAADIRGIVTGPAGPTGGQLLRLVPDSGEDFGAGFETAVTVSGPGGRFWFRNVPAGSYLIEGRSSRSLAALSPDFVQTEASTNVRRADDEWWSRTPVSLFGEAIEDLVVMMRPTLSLSGRIIFESSEGLAPTTVVESIRIGLLPVTPGRAGVPAAQPIATGSFAMHGIMPARYYLDVQAPPGWHVDAATGLGTDLTSMPLDATSAPSEIVIAIRMSDSTTALRGTVRDQRGTPMDDAVVLAFPADGSGLPPMRTRQVRVSASGEFSIGGLPPGNYRVVAFDAGAAGDWQAPSRLETLRAGSTAVMLQAGEQHFQDLRVVRGR